MKKKIIFLLTVSTLCCMVLASCGNKNGNQGKDPLTGENLEEEGNTETQENTENAAGDTQMEDFQNLLSQENNAPGVVEYIKNNVEGASEEERTQYFSGLLGYGEDIREIDFTGLDESKQYMPEDMIAFLELMKLEKDTPSMAMSEEENRRVIGLTLSEMLERALLFEQHLDKYPNAVTTEAAEKLYEEIVTAAVTGGYDKEAGIAHYYQGDTEDVVDQKSLEYYQQFAEANKDSRLGKIIAEYITVLQENQFQINDTMSEFYISLSQKLRQ